MPTKQSFHRNKFLRLLLCIRVALQESCESLQRTFGVDVYKYVTEIEEKIHGSLELKVES